LKYLYLVIMPLRAGEGEWQVCECDSPTAAAEVVRIILENGKDKPPSITIRVVPCSN
jgi:hypothetical protein